MSGPVDAPTPALLQKPMSLQNALIAALTSALLASAGTGGITSLLGSDDHHTVEMQADIRAMQEDMREMRAILTLMTDRVEQTHTIVEQAHPRFPSPPQRGDN